MESSRGAGEPSGFHVGLQTSIFFLLILIYGMAGGVVLLMWRSAKRGAAPRAE